MLNHKPLAAMFAASLLAGCSTGVPDYMPRSPNGSVGYTDLQLSPNRYRVSFSGSSASKRDDVENYLLRRAAEITLQAGYTHFVVDMRDVERDTYYVGNTFVHAPYYPYGYGPGYFGDTAWPVTSYSVYAEIVTLKPEDAAGNPAAVEAQSLLRRLMPPPPVRSASQQP